MRPLIRAGWYLSLLSLQLLYTLTACADEGAAAVLRCMDSNLPEVSSIRGLELRSESPYKNRQDSSATRIVRASVYVKRASDDTLRALTYFHEPFDIRGSRILFLEQDTGSDAYLFVPAMPGVRRLTAGNISSSLQGTDFSYEDFQQLYGVTRGRTVTREPDGELDGREVYVLSSRPDEPARSLYKRVIAHVDKQTCVTIRMELFAKKQRPRKVLAVRPESVRQVEGYWIPHEMTMHDQRFGTETRLLVHSIEINTPLPDEMFEQSRLAEFEPR